MVISKDTFMNQEKNSLLREGQYFYCKKNKIIINYCYNTQFAIPIFGLPIHYNVPRLNIIEQKAVILNSSIFSEKTCPLHNYVSTENITILTEKAIEWCNCL